MTDLRDFFDQLIFQGARRFTQQSPVMPDVWFHFGLCPEEPRDLLLIPHRRSSPATLAADLRERLERDPKISRKTRLSRIAYNQSSVAANLTFDEVIRDALPLSAWWQKHLLRKRKQGEAGRDSEEIFDPMEVLHNSMDAKKRFRAALIKAFEDTESARDFQIALPAGDDEEKIFFTREMVWLAQIVGTIAYLAEKIPEVFDKPNPQAVYQDQNRRTQGKVDVDLMVWLQKLLPGDEDYPAEEIADALLTKYEDFPLVDKEKERSLFLVNRNRDTEGAIAESTAAVKADAAQRLFNVGGRDIRWAVLDSGIDARHLAFRKRVRRDGRDQPRTPAFEKKGKRLVNNTRIKGSYNFVPIRDLLSLELLPGESNARQLADIEEQLAASNPDLLAWLKQLDRLEMLRGALALQGGHAVNWEQFAQIIAIPHDEGYDDYVPKHPHGTHVAGIIGADWRAGDQDADGLDADPPIMAEGSDRFTGVAPEIELYDLRVLDEAGRGNEFSIMSALQFVRFLNDRHDYVEIHGVNLSFSIAHDISNYACGRTPVCVECENLVGNGIVVVAAAGNSGRARFLRPDGVADEGFRTVSITDPGNAQGVITVGSTHRSEPHTYGVSYFSSRGPTGDGRLKPDLVAPGEKICSTIPRNRDLYLDGTSMAAPHVSGAAALLMDRNYELIKRPDRIKEVLCKSATDLGREPYFQGAGLLDILRALQSV